MLIYQITQDELNKLNDLVGKLRSVAINSRYLSLEELTEEFQEWHRVTSAAAMPRKT